MSKKTPIETREKLVRAAAQLVISKGIARVTLEQVALDAGVSKGGLLHHFPTLPERAFRPLPRSRRWRACVTCAGGQWSEFR